MSHALDALFSPRHVAVVGACPNDPTRMGTRTLFDLVGAGWHGDIWPISSRHEVLYGLKTCASLRELVTPPDVVLARTPQAGIESLVDDAVAIGARFLIVLASGFAETGAQGLEVQRALVERAHQGGLRIVGPQSIGLVHTTMGLPLSLSQIMERFEMRRGSVALLTQSGAMAISLSIRGQQHVGLDFSLVATFGNAADVTPIEALDWLAQDPHTRVIGLYLEGLHDAEPFAQAVARCQRAGKSVVVLRSGLSERGAAAVATHTASMSGDEAAFRALCDQLGVVRCESSEDFLWALKALSAPGAAGHTQVAFASISGGACALWADRCEQWGLDLPALDAQRALALAARLPSFLTASNPLDLGPAVFDDTAFEGALRGLLSQPSIERLVVYLFTSSPSLMGGLSKLRLLESVARSVSQPVWVIWEAATDEEWQALSRSEALCGFRDLGQAARALHACSLAVPKAGFRAPLPPVGAATKPTGPLSTEVAMKAWLREAGLQVPRGQLCTDAAGVHRAAHALGTRLVVKIASAQVPHKSDVGGVVLCSSEPEAAARARDQVLDSLRAHRPEVEPDGVLVEERIDERGLEMVVTVRRDPVYGLVTVIGRGGIAVEVDHDIVVQVGALNATEVIKGVTGLRCAPLLRGHRGSPTLALEALALTVVRLQQAVMSATILEVELNPVLLTAQHAWVLDALAVDQTLQRRSDLAPEAS